LASNSALASTAGSSISPNFTTSGARWGSVNCKRGTASVRRLLDPWRRRPDSGCEEIAVELKDLSGARLGQQPVDVLCRQRRCRLRALQLHERVVSWVR
jgi:hypothetical protein